MNTNIQSTFDHKNDLINRHLRYLYESSSATILKIQAIEFLYPYIEEDRIREKLEFFYRRERDSYIKNLLREALNGSLESFIQTKFDDDAEPELEEDSTTSAKSLSAQDITLLRLSNN
ncbi:MAG: hypothetical protein OXU45_01135 [Candidatus Melainabacteria bacterium]|nr:hypothetical protein [Candidatus Melainabacteria bacterium]